MVESVARIVTALERFYHLPHVLRTFFGHDQQGVFGVDDHQIMHADESDQLTALV